MIIEEQRCLKALYKSTVPDGEMCVHFLTIQKATGFDRARVRRHVRRLARKGFAEYYKGLWGYDDRPAGAGYCISKAGQDELKRLYPEVVGESLDRSEWGY